LETSLSERLVMGIFRAGPGALRITPALNMCQDDIAQALARLNAAVKAC
jgi:acetylornithine/succinyldiaminopimelate/putrescine aminotransferase